MPPCSEHRSFQQARQELDSALRWAWPGRDDRVTPGNATRDAVAAPQQHSLPVMPSGAPPPAVVDTPAGRHVADRTGNVQDGPQLTRARKV